MRENTLSNENLIATGTTRIFIVIAVMIVAVLEMIDVTIVNVALKSMMGSFGATRDQITWILTSYVLASGVIIPLAGYLTDVLGRRKLLVISITGFLFASTLCGFAQSLAQMVFFRVLQGVFGASLLPLSQIIMIKTFYPHEGSLATSIWGMGIMTGPIIGPTLGGYIIDAFNWRWIFFINIPFCILSLILTFSFIKETSTIPRSRDWFGAILMISGIGCLQLFLDRGHGEDWFESRTILFLFVGACFLLTMFIIRGIGYKDNIINFELFRIRNFSICCLTIITFSATYFAMIALQPIYLQQLLGFSAKQAGLLVAPRGVSSAISMVLSGWVITKIDARIIIGLGLLISAFATHLMTQFDLHTSFSAMIPATLIQGVGGGMFLAPIYTVIFNDLPNNLHAEASALSSFFRSLGISIGIALATTYVQELSQFNWNNLVHHLAPFNANLQNWLLARGWSDHDPRTIVYFTVQLFKQSSMLAFTNYFWVNSLLFLLIIGFVPFLSATNFNKDTDTPSH